MKTTNDGGRKPKMTRLLGGFCVATVFSLTGCLRGDPGYPDQFEPNDTQATATVLPGASDAGTNTSYSLTLDDANDRDFFKVHVEDRGSDGNPEIWLTAEGDGTWPIALDATFACDGGDEAGEAHVVESTPVNNGREVHFTTSCPGGFFDDDDSGTLEFSVHRASSNAVPMFYDLSLRVD